MPRSAGRLVLALVVALLVRDYAIAAEGSPDAAMGGGKDQGHVDLAIGGADGAVGGDKGYDHVDFSIDESDAATGDDKGDGHVDFSVDGSDSTTPSDKDENHVDLSVDPDGAYTVDADLMPGAEGAEIRGFDGDPENVHVDFRITIGPDGRIEVNGRELATCDPATGCRISLSWCPGTGALVVQAEDASGAVCAAQYAMEGAPEGISISAAEVRSLSVLRQ